MTLCIVVKTPSGLALAVDSRVTISRRVGDVIHRSHLDSATKLLTFGKVHNNVAAVTYGNAIIPGTERTPESYITELVSDLPKEQLSVRDFSRKLAVFFAERIPGDYSDNPSPMVTQDGVNLYIIGYDPDEASPYGCVFYTQVQKHPVLIPQFAGNSFGASWGGDDSYIQRLYFGLSPGGADFILNHVPKEQRSEVGAALENRFAIRVPFGLIGLQDGVDFAVSLIRMTALLQRLTLSEATVGGHIDVATVTKSEGLRLVQVKEVKVHAI